jgi:hypothetical protein
MRSKRAAFLAVSSVRDRRLVVYDKYVEARVFKCLNDRSMGELLGGSRNNDGNGGELSDKITESSELYGHNARVAGAKNPHYGSGSSHSPGKIIPLLTERPFINQIAIDRRMLPKEVVVGLPSSVANPHDRPP